MFKISCTFTFLIIFVFSIYSQSGDTTTTQSGLKYLVIRQGKGTKAENGKDVEVNYTGRLTNGKVFDSSYDRNEPIEFILGAGQVIKGWDEGIALMRVGDKYQLIIPPELGYGDKGAGDLIPPNSTLVFDVELMGVHKPLKSVADTMLYTIVFSNIKDALKLYKNLKKNNPGDYNFKESQLNSLGYELIKGDRVKDAIEIFKLNIKEYPESFNVYDSMGEAYMIDGQDDLAIENYEESLDINPKNDNAKKMIDKINANRK